MLKFCFLYLGSYSNNTLNSTLFLNIIHVISNTERMENIKRINVDSLMHNEYGLGSKLVFFVSKGRLI